MAPLAVMVVASVAAVEKVLMPQPSALMAAAVTVRSPVPRWLALMPILPVPLAVAVARVSMLRSVAVAAVSAKMPWPAVAEMVPLVVSAMAPPPSWSTWMA